MALAVSRESPLSTNKVQSGSPGVGEQEVDRQQALEKWPGDTYQSNQKSDHSNMEFLCKQQSNQTISLGK